MNEESLFAAAREKSSAAERRAFLDAACGGDVGLRDRVERLLAADDRSRGILDEGPGATALLAVCQPAPPLAADQPFAGRFLLRRKLGEGGMGEVWVADQTDPVRRRVALKVIRPGLDSARLLARFEAERQALALMDHPNIARVLDAGVAGDDGGPPAAGGRPYFVMELIDGAPITAYCDQAGLPLRQRLELFVPVCRAVQHAHQKGVIHRDLKPSNVLVATYDGKPVPKVIDFGIAKVTGPGLGEYSAATEVGALIGTLEYMPPEQVEPNSRDVDTRSDVYALGVVLYELLTGDVPFPRRQLHAAPFAEMLRLIKEVEPPTPSARLAEARTAAVGSTGPRLYELDWIAMKCLEKDRARRYESASALAADVQRYLADEPVLAGPPSAAYRVRKFLRRNRGPVLAASLVVLALVGGFAGTTIGLVQAEQKRKDAVAAQGAEADQRRLAEEERTVAQAVNDFVQRDLLGQADLENQPGGAGGDRDPDVKVRTVLDRAARTVETRFANQPRVEAAIRLTIAKAYLALAHYKEAQLHAERSVALRAAHLGADHADTLTSQDVLAWTYAGQGFDERAVALFQEVLEKRTTTLGSDHLDTLSSKLTRALIHSERGQYALAEPLMLEVVRKQEARLGARDSATLWSKNALACLHMFQGNYDLAAGDFIELITAYESAFGQDHPGTLLSKSNLALVYQGQGKYAEAVPLRREVAQRRMALQGPGHPNTQGSKIMLGGLYSRMREFDQAVPILEEGVAAFKTSLGEDHPKTLMVMNWLALAYLEWGKPELALPLFEHVSAKYTETPPLSDAEKSYTAVGLARAYLATKRPERAERHLREYLATLAKTGFDGWATFDARSLLGQALMGQKKYADAGPLLVQGYEGMKQREIGIPANDKVRLTEALERLVQLYDATDKPAEAAEWRQELEARSMK